MVIPPNVPPRPYFRLAGVSTPAPRIPLPRQPSSVYEDFKPSSEWTQDHESHYLVIDLPDFTKEQLRVRVLSSNTLRVSGERIVSAGKRSRFSEDFKIPDDTDVNSITAKFEDGFLRVRFPLIKDVEEPNESRSRTNLETPPEAEKVMSREVPAVDPDSGSSSLCSGCRLPIFLTPSIPVSHGGESLFLHEQCSRPPEHLQHELHPEHGLVLLDQLRFPTPATDSTATCRNCGEICGTMLYQCPYKGCDYQLDLLCALQIKIVHRSHNHSLTAVRLRDFAPITCNACDTKHEAPSSSSKAAETTESAVTMSYLCNLCGFWVHPDCASLPNPILHYEDHKHSLFLTFNLHISADSKCFICSGLPKRTSGFYFCLKCPNYLVHIRCAVTRPDTFKPVFIRDALVTDLGRLPLANEEKSLIPYFREHAVATSTNSDDHYQQNLHSHPLIFHKSDYGASSSSSSQSSRVCNACVQFLSPPFFSCSQCPDFFLHSCCANLPTQIQHRVHEDHPLSLSLKAPKSDISARFVCKGCGLWCNGFAYTCEECDDFSMDVVCALINPAITHESHDKTHILFMSIDTHFESGRMCNCCSSILSGICYECSICRNFKLHVRCALLPGTVRHVFDKHPLQLTSKKSTIDDDDDDDDLCEICEEHLQKGHWFYSCGECDQSFHVDCIPSVDRLSRMKLGSAVRVDGHGCPVVLVRQDDGVCGGRRCGFCGEILKFSDDGGLAYECSKCFSCVHHKCVEKCLLEHSQ